MDSPSSKENQTKQSSSRRVTLRDIAVKIGVSHTTVSRALNNSTEVSEKMKKRIRLKAEDMGYAPDPLLSALSNYRLTSRKKPVQSALAWINTWQHPEKMRENKEFDLYWKGAKETATRMGFKLEEFRTAEVPLKRLERIFKTRKTLGILIGPAHDLSLNGASTDLNDFSWKDFAVVRFGRTSAYPSSHFVTSAQTSNTSDTFNIIRKKGYRRIGYAGLLRSMRIFGSGYNMAQQHIPKNQRLAPLYFNDDQSIYNQQDQFVKWLRKAKPDAIITDSPELLSMLPNLGYKIPEDIALATTSIHDTPINAGIDQEPKEIGRTAIRTLAGLINEQNFGIPKNRTEILIEGSWINGSMLPDRC